jgi:hypothetical protein
LVVSHTREYLASVVIPRVRMLGESGLTEGNADVIFWELGGISDGVTTRENILEYFFERDLCLAF